MDPMTISAIAQGAGGIVQGVTGLIQKAQAKKIARNNKRPVYKIQDPVLENQAIAESRAGQGISDASRQELKQESERGLTSSIDAILSGGGSVNNIADLYSNFQGGVSKMALLDEEMRTRNIQNLISQNNTLAAEKDKEWQVNVFAPYADKAQAAAALTKQGSDNIWKGVNSVISAGTNYATGQLYKKESNNVYNQTGNTGNDAAPPPVPSAPINPNGSANPYNWYNTNSNPPPQRPLTAQEKANLDIQNRYPGFINGNMNSGFSFNPSMLKV
jgi:hypothetical protein